MLPAIVIRPQPGCDASVASLAARGIEAKGFPLFEIRPMPWEAPEETTFDAILVGSANAIRHGGLALGAYSGKPAYAVGERTAQAAREAGLNVIATGSGGLQDVLAELRADHRNLLRLTAEKRVDLDPPEGVTIHERTVYASEPLPIPPELAQLLRDPALVLLHSGEAARHFAESCDKLGVSRGRISLAAIGTRVADAAGGGWANVKCAEKPNEDELLALAEHMCKEEGTSHDHIISTMQDTTKLDSTQEQRPRTRSTRDQIAVALLAFLLGMAVLAWIIWRGYLDVPVSETAVQPLASEDMATEPDADAQQADAGTPQATAARKQLRSVTTVEARLAMLEDRLSRLNLQASAASGNAARAENLLIAFAARRMVDRGQPLRYLDDQLRLRFTNAQPRAVETIIKFSESPVTLDQLSARLEALSPQLTEGTHEESFWDKAGRELSDLFTIRRTQSTVLSPAARIDRASVMLTARKIPEAIAEVERLPGAAAAERWILDAQRYAAVQDALDLIETAAMLEPSRLQDSEGKLIDQPSPLASPVAPADAKAAQKPAQ